LSKYRSWHRGVVGIIFAVFAAYPAGAESLVPLQGHVAQQIQSATLVERAPADEMVTLSLVVRLDQTLLDQTFESLYGRSAPAQKHFLSSAEFAQKFDLADKRKMLKDFAQANGLSLDTAPDQPESLIVKVSGPSSAVEKTFSVQLNHYRDARGRAFRANTTDPMIPASLATHLGSVLGLSNLAGMFNPRIRHPSTKSSSAMISGGTGPNGGLSPTDIKTIYGLSQTSLTGSGQTVALFELDSFVASDITAYEAQFGLPSITVTPVNVDGSAYAPNTPDGQIEVSLDIEMIAALAPGVSKILVYEGPAAAVATNQNVLDTYDRIATDNAAQVASTSWGLNEQDSGLSVIQSESQIFQRMAVQGQTMYAAAGDCGAYDQEDHSGHCITTNGFRVDDPASQPYVTGVGGTSLSGSVASPTETTWNEFASIEPSGTGGGVSAVWPLPSFQQGVRNVPDVALNSDPDTSPYSICVNGSCNACVPGNCPTLVGGTSAAAPLWAAVTALINQSRATLGTGSFGFANANLYQLATSTSSATLFNDITTGNNAHFNAGTGYDNATGWGSFKGGGLINSAGTLVAQISLETLPNVYAFPNPWDIRRTTQRQVTIANVPDDATIKTFTVSGFWVKTLTASNTHAVWDLTNDSRRARRRRWLARCRPNPMPPGLHRREYLKNWPPRFRKPTTLFL